MKIKKQVSVKIAMVMAILLMFSSLALKVSSDSTNNEEQFYLDEISSLKKQISNLNDNLEKLQQPPIDRDFTDKERITLYQMINEYRKSNGLNELVINPVLESSARAKAEDMILRNYWAHSFGDHSAWEQVDSSGYRYAKVGENLAQGYFEPLSLLDAWEKSPEHNENLLGKEYRDFGISAICDGNNARYLENCLVVLYVGSKY